MKEFVTAFKEYIDNVGALPYSEFESEMSKLDEFPDGAKNLLIAALFLELRSWRGADARRTAAAGN